MLTYALNPIHKLKVFSMVQLVLQSPTAPGADLPFRIY